MNRIIILNIVIFLSVSLVSISCKDDKTAIDNSLTTKEVISNSTILLNKIVNDGDFINNNKVPTLIDSESVNRLIDSNVLIIDIRNSKDYAEGHIKGAINIKYKELIDYFQVSGIPDYDKVVIVCYTGQSASYAASILQLVGYKNVYAMNWGMCAWNKKFSSRWIKNSTNRLISQLEKQSNPKMKVVKLPHIESSRKSGIEILNIRTKKLLEEGFKEASITIDDIISSPGTYYIINYCEQEKYIKGHLKSAVQYNPNSSLNQKTDLLTIPTDKTVVVYCNTGQYSAYIVAYLRLIGYKAKTLKYGANGFMTKLVLENRAIGQGFSEELINNFKFETSEYIETDDGPEEGGC